MPLYKMGANENIIKSKFENYRRDDHREDRRKIENYPRDDHMEDRRKIQSQNRVLYDEINNNKTILQDSEINKKKAQYQMEMYESLTSVNTLLLFFYYFCFVLIHVLLAEHYFRGIKRNEIVDTLWFTLFFIYPAIIYYVEMYIYQAYHYITSFIYGNTYVYNFDRALLNTDFYLAPNSDTTNSGIPTIAANL